MAKCSNCGANVDGMKFCAECGTRVPQDKECPACKARMPIAAKFCSECGHSFSNTDSGSAEKENLTESAPCPSCDNAQSVADRVDGNEPVETHSVSARCSISLKSAGNDKEAVARELCSLFNRTLGQAKSIVERAPIPLHLDIARDEAERIADVLGRVGATVELFDHDAGTQTHGNCSVVLRRIPSGMSIPDKAVLGAEIAMLLGCMPRNAFKMLDDLPLTVAENVSRKEADEIVNKFAKRKCVAEIV